MKWNEYARVGAKLQKACKAIIGSKFGYNAIPEEYKDGLLYRDQLDKVISMACIYIELIMFV